MDTRPAGGEDDTPEQQEPHQGGAQDAMEAEVEARGHEVATAAAQSVRKEELSAKDLALEARIQANPLDVEAWEELISRVHLVSPERARSVLERATSLFPFSGWLWVRFAQLEESLQNDEKVREIIARCLHSCFCVDVWTFYLQWLSRSGHGPEGRATLMDAFEEAIKPQNVGCAVDAFSIWRSYLDFLKTEPEETSFDKNTKITRLRKVYQRCIQLPIRNVDVFWKEYSQFEQVQGGGTTKKVLDDEQPKFAHANEVLKERDLYWRQVLPVAAKAANSLPRPYGKTSIEAQRVQYWQALLAYERTNPEHVGTVDFKLRVRLAYRHALQDLYFYPEIWFGFAEFESTVSDAEACATILRSGLKALPDSSLLGLSLADALEVDSKKDEAREVHEHMVAKTRSNLAYCHLMRFARRVDGVAAARAVFKRARESEACDATVYLLAARLELHANKSPQTCRSVFELGLKRFPGDTFLLTAYLDFVESLNDDAAARDLFERTVEALGTSEEALRVWERYRAFVRDRCEGGGDLQALASIERRMAERFSSNRELTGLLGVAHRFGIFGVLPTTSAADAGFFDRNAVTVSSAPTTSSHLTHSRGPSRAPTSAKQHQQATEVPEDLESVPPFLRKLVTMLPRRSAIANMDVDFVIRSLAKGTLPPAPVARAFESADDVSRKRRLEDAVLGAQGAPEDAFKVRQQTKRSKT